MESFFKYILLNDSSSSMFYNKKYTSLENDLVLRDYLSLIDDWLEGRK